VKKRVKKRKANHASLPTIKFWLARVMKKCTFWPIFWKRCKKDPDKSPCFFYLDKSPCFLSKKHDKNHYYSQWSKIYKITANENFLILAHSGSHILTFYWHFSS
jgi:hypothetical protein